MDSNQILRVGPHTAWIEPPDIFATGWRGDITPGHMRAMYDELDKFAASCPTVFLLNIVRDAGALGPETRRVASTDPRAKCVRAMATVGASFHTRVIASMVTRAAALIGRTTNTHVAFFATEDEGRRWLAAKRIELAAPPVQAT